VSDSKFSRYHDPSAFPLNAVETVKRHAEWFFAGKKFDTSEAISLLVQEATRGGAGAVKIDTERGWVSITADVDWLEGDVAAFFAPLSYLAGGRNSSRVEVALTAFCDAVVTATSKGVFEVKSGEHVTELHELSTEGRTVAFLPPLEERPPSLEEAKTAQPQTTTLRLVQGEGAERISAAVASFLEKQQSA